VIDPLVKVNTDLFGTLLLQCPICLGEFRARRRHAVTCGPKCRKAWQRWVSECVAQGVDPIQQIATVELAEKWKSALPYWLWERTGRRLQRK
jgi:hypothetical protein